MMVFWRTRKIKSNMTKEERKQVFMKMWNFSPIYDNTHIQLHCLRIPYREIPTGMNHNTDHQLARHGVYSFLLSRLGIKNTKVSRATGLHINPPVLSRGYKFDATGKIISNYSNTSGDQLIGLTLAMLDESDDIVKEQYEQLVIDIIKNDYSLIEVNKYGIVTKKAPRGMWSPGIETLGAQSLTLLSTLKMAAKLGSPDAKKEYKKMIWKYGYGLLSFIPTLFAPWKRNYFNDNNCISAAYILASLSDNKFSKFYWSLVALNVWSLSYKWNNAYFTGMIKELFPKLISDKYVQKCKDYLYSEEPIDYSKNVITERQPLKFPVKFNLLQLGEFSPSQDHKVTCGTPKYRSTLGWLSSAILIDEKEAKEFIDD
jgi:hypothetical protein